MECENVLVEAAAATEAVVDSLLANVDTRTRDMDGPLGTRAFGDGGAPLQRPTKAIATEARADRGVGGGAERRRSIRRVC